MNEQHRQEQDIGVRAEETEIAAPLAASSEAGGSPERVEPTELGERIESGAPSEPVEPTVPVEHRESRERSERGEASPPSPRIYVASLADYNDGRLHGVWMDANQEAEELQTAITAMLGASPENHLCVWCGQEAIEHPKWDEVRGAHGMVPGQAEEWAIHDHEGFGKLSLSEYEDLPTISALGKGITEHGAAFAAWASLLGTIDAEGLSRFPEAFLGTWESVEAYAEEFLDDMGATAELAKLPEWLQSHVSLDVAGFARDLVLGGDIIAVGDDEGVHVFDGRG